MKLLYVLAAPLVALLPAGLHQDQTQERSHLRNVAAESHTEVDESAWKQDLAQPDLQERETAFERLVASARRDEAVRKMLERWEADGGDLAWTAHLALREVDLRSRRFGRPLSRGWGLDGSGLRPFDRLGFAFDRPGFFGPGRDGSAQDFLDELEQGLGNLFDKAPDADASSEMQSFRLETGPDGVRAEVRKMENGDETVKTYEAKTLDELYDLHPELRDHLMAGKTGPASWSQDLDRLFDRLRGKFDRGESRGLHMPTDKLGILMREPGQWSASVEGLDPGVGLYIERVFPGTLAGALGLEPGDILIELGGKQIGSGADVRAVLRDRAKGAPLTAVVLDGEGTRRELTWKPAPPVQ